MLRLPLLINYNTKKKICIHQKNQKLLHMAGVFINAFSRVRDVVILLFQKNNAASYVIDKK
jgi:hypothetical protein